MSWSTLKTEAVIINSYPIREADRRYSALTKNFGKLSFLGRGAGKIKAKLAPHLEPFAIVDLEVVQGRRSTTVISVEKKVSFTNIAGSFNKRILALHSLSWLNRQINEGEQDPSLYIELLIWLKFLNNSPELTPRRSAFVMGAFLLKIMSILGYGAELKRCLSCKGEIFPLAFRWHGGRGGLVCSDCVKKDLQEWFAARRLEEDAVRMLRAATDMRYYDLLKIRLSSEMLSDFLQTVNDLAAYHLPYGSESPFWSGLAALEGDSKIM
ncbi:DNA repair protein RecO [Candidatus Parcubacteria bacterium]|nr:MAG: DNA repair protein RecO [Candidatus Parcubacteria bacterium]